MAQTKICSICKLELGIENFYKNVTHKDGLTSYCKSCHNYKDRTVEGLIRRIYEQQKSSSKLRDHTKPSYTYEELLTWFNNQPNAEKLYKEWVISNYDTWKRPSIDRLDDYQGYSFENIQLVTWKENNTKFHKEAINGINNKLNEEVSQYSLSGEYINSFYSLAEAARRTKVNRSNISACCIGTKVTAGGYQWSKERTSSIGPAKTNGLNGGSKTIGLYSQEGILLHLCESAKAAAKIIGAGKSTIAQKANQNKVLTEGFKHINGVIPKFV